jgi:precorrin-6B methylase 2
VPVLKVATYIAEAVKAKRQFSDGCTVAELANLFPVWRRNLESKRTPIDDELPWLTFAAIQFLDAHLTASMRVFEFGCGGSTLFFAARTHSVISIEHDAAWAERVRTAVAATGRTNLQLRVVNPIASAQIVDLDPADPDSYATTDETHRANCFKDYATAIDEYPDEYFDVVLIDGRSRPSCAKHAARKVKKLGLLILDNAERVSYAKVHEQLDGQDWKRRSFYGPGPFNPYFWLTVIWQKPT